ncbi:hypothetical protein J2X72_000747 [Phyllobacterium sp. 1468]|uniref:hypothetical protein n=1 Tax=Phyllobacterium sp. 1468 TaxID=2817759 RepID=UPI0028609F95|nr:hypothetical protein [Phyllobacterium sp. 1468]MDR6631976.1 hypothetical protein [Phyllobacterium sp. 1468]
MRTLRIAAMSMVLVVATSLSYAEQTDPVVPTNQTRCSDAQNKLAGAVKDYKGAKFALDRAIQLLGSARYSSRIGKMNLDMASRQADADAATTSYVGSIGPAYGAVALINVSCSDNSIRAPGMRFLKSVDLDVAKFLAGAADKLADDQMADIKKMFDEMKEGRK